MWCCTTLQVTVDVPDQKGRLAILKVHAKNKKLSEEIDLSQIAMRTPGFSGADLANLLNEVCARFAGCVAHGTSSLSVYSCVWNSHCIGELPLLHS